MSESEHIGRKRSRSGRPRKPKSERRRHKYLVSANDPEREAIEAGAAATGLPPAAFLRQAGVGAKLKRRADNVAYHRLSQIGVRLRMLAQAAGVEDRPDEQKELETLLEEILDLRSMF